MNTIVVDTRLADFYSVFNKEFTCCHLREAFQDSSKHNQPCPSLKPEMSDRQQEGPDSAEKRRWHWRASLRHLSSPLEQEPLGYRGREGLPKPHFQPIICGISTSHCGNKSFRELIKELTLKANSRAQPVRGSSLVPADRIWPTDLFEFAWVVQAKL